MSEAIISGSAAFLAPEIGILPLSLLPPTIRMRSMKPHDNPVPKVRASRRARFKAHSGPAQLPSSLGFDLWPGGHAGLSGDFRARAWALRRARFSRSAVARRSCEPALPGGAAERGLSVTSTPRGG